MTQTVSIEPAVSLPREQWSSHPHYPSQVLLMGSHQNFLRINAHLIEEADVIDEPSRLENLYRRWISAMRSHEGYEEHKLYPYLERRWSTSMEAAEAGHAALHATHERVLEAFARTRVTDETHDHRPALVQALREHESILRAHLDLEEELVIPLLLELTPGEFHRFCALPIDTLLAELDPLHS